MMTVASGTHGRQGTRRRRISRAGRALGPAIAVAAAIGALGLGGAGLLFMLKPTTGTASTGGGGGPGGQASLGTVEAVLMAVGERVRAGETGQGEAILREAITRWPEDQELRLSLADMLVSGDRLTAAYEEYERALAIGPRTHELEFKAGLIASLEDRQDRAVEHFSMAQSGDATNAEYPLRLGQSQLRLGLLGESKANLVRSAVLDPERAIVWGTLAEIALRENRLGICRQHIAKARELEPMVSAWRLIEARARKREGDAEGALLVMLGIAETERREAAILRLMAECYGYLGRLDEAAGLYAEAAEATPSDGDLAFEAAVWFERAGDTGRAAEAAQRAAMLGHKGGQALLDRLRSEDGGGG